MRDIHHKIHSLRIARASARLLMRTETVQLVKENTGPKKDIVPTAKAAAYLAVKNTSATIPLCHPLPIEDITVDIDFDDSGIEVRVEVKTIYKTGVEIEAMHGASVAALTIYDMVKPVDKEVEIANIRLDHKSGGKSDHRQKFPKAVDAAVLICSDIIFSGKKQAMAGEAVREKLSKWQADIKEYEVLPDDQQMIHDRVQALIKEGRSLILTVGGTGLGPKDVTPQAVAGLIETAIPGIVEAARAYGQQRTPKSMMSRSVAGLSGNSLIITLPGSTKGASESMEALFPYVLHVFKVLEDGAKYL